MSSSLPTGAYLASGRVLTLVPDEHSGPAAAPSLFASVARTPLSPDERLLLLLGATGALLNAACGRRLVVESATSDFGLYDLDAGGRRASIIVASSAHRPPSRACLERALALHCAAAVVVCVRRPCAAALATDDVAELLWWCDSDGDLPGADVEAASRTAQQIFQSCLVPRSSLPGPVVVVHWDDECESREQLRRWQLTLNGGGTPDTGVSGGRACLWWLGTTPTPIEARVVHVCIGTSSDENAEMRRFNETQCREALRIALLHMSAQPEAATALSAPMYFSDVAQAFAAAHAVEAMTRGVVSVPVWYAVTGHSDASAQTMQAVRPVDVRMRGASDLCVHMGRDWRSARVSLWWNCADARLWVFVRVVRRFSVFYVASVREDALVHASERVRAALDRCSETGGSLQLNVTDLCSSALE